MARLGLNLKLTTAQKHRTLVGRVLGDVLGGTLHKPSPTMDQYKLADGTSIGVAIVGDDEGLSDAALRKAPWLEFVVDDVSTTRAALAKLGIEPFEYADRSHLYFQIPGGPVFRLAPPS